MALTALDVGLTGATDEGPVLEARRAAGGRAS
jgi:hypothetical protein